MTGVLVWYVYILRCADGSLYTGVTNDLAARIRTHNDGKGAKYTRGRLPVVLVYSESAADRGAAQRRERAIKRLRTAMKRRLLDTPAPRVARAPTMLGAPSRRPVRVKD